MIRKTALMLALLAILAGCATVQSNANDLDKSPCACKQLNKDANQGLSDA